MKVKVSVSTGLVGSRRKDTLEIPDEEVADMSPDELESYIEEQAQDWLWNTIDFGFSVVEEPKKTQQQPASEVTEEVEESD